MSPTQQLNAVLSGLAKDRSTGSLRVGRTGTVYFDDGRVSYVESTSTPGVEDLLTASGRISAAALRGARQSSGGEELVRQGLVTRGELQFCVLSASLDAALFVLTATTARPRFKEGERHWLGDQWYFDVAGLYGECRRRRERLDRVWPSPGLDSRPVVLTQRLTAQRIVLTDVQWEIVRSADATATPLELARRLGRPAYAVLLAVHRLGAAGLLLEPEPPPGTEPPGPPPAGRPAPHGRDTSGSPASDRRTATPQKAAPPSLPTRAGRDGAAGPRPRTTSVAADSRLPQVSADATDISVLIRLRDALQRLA